VAALSSRPGRIPCSEISLLASSCFVAVTEQNTDRNSYLGCQDMREWLGEKFIPQPLVGTVHKKK